MEVLYSPAVVASIVSLMVVVVTALLKDNFGETESDRLLKVGQASMRVAQMILEAAEIAVLEVEESLKKSGGLTPEELKRSAVTITADLLSNWGMVVNQQLVESLFAVVESAYQKMKA